MKPRTGAIVGLLFLATCSEDLNDANSSKVESSARGLGTVPASEVAVWQKVSSSNLPDGRYLQAAAFDETRRVLVVFGGMTVDQSMGNYTPSRETWEWSPKTGKWTNRTGTGTAPEARSGAAMVYDPVRDKFVLFGGRAGGRLNLEDTWEWDPKTGSWTNMTAAGSHPSARSQHGMVYEKGSGKILLFGGGRSNESDTTGTIISASFGDTWEYDPVNYTWKQLSPASAPSVRHDFGLVWDSVHSKAVLFGGMQVDITDAPGVPKQDTWEWDPSGTWTERTAAGNKPSQRYGHAMGFDGKRGKVLLFGGLDVSSGGSRNDLWELEPTTYAWTEPLTGAESGVPYPRMYASLVSDDVSGLLELVAGITPYGSYGSGGVYGSGGYYGTGGAIAVPVGIGPGYGTVGSREVWELDPSKPAFTDRSSPLDVPSPRYSQVMAYNPSAGKTYLFGGYDSSTGQPLNDLWEWDGKVWAQVAADSRPSARSDAGLAYDPARKSLILFGGMDYMTGMPLDDTWEFGTDRKWTQLKPASGPDPLSGHRMVTDTTRGKILLFGGMSTYVWNGSGVYKDPMRTDVWEWDGSTTTWTNRTSPAQGSGPGARYAPLLTYDEGRQKLFLFDGMNYGASATAFWEWDPLTAGWASRDAGSSISNGYSAWVAYDSIRRRQIILQDPSASTSGKQETWEIDTKGPTLYIRTTATAPGGPYGASLTFDSARGVVVLYGGQNMNGYPVEDTWEYKVTNLGNGEGCTAAFTSSCASGFCVEGVCCDVAACTGACKSCSVAGSEGTCVLAAPGTEVPGSCSEGKACDATGLCKTKNGQPCAAATECASGICADGVCCDSSCSGTCASCNQTGRAGKCTPFAAGTDPQNECGQGTGQCKSTCDGVGACVFPQWNVTCGNCLLCNGSGDCTVYDYNSCFNTGGNFGGSGGRPYPVGGSGGYIPFGGSGGAGGRPVGGSGGSVTYVGGNAGGAIPIRGGAGGGVPAVGGNLPNVGGAGGVTIPITVVYDGGLPVVGGTAGSVPRVGGAGGAIPGLGGSTSSTAKLDGSAGSIPIFGLGGAVGDAKANDAGNANLHKSGCGCELGGSGLAGSGVSLPFLFAAAALLLRRQRRRR